MFFTFNATGQNLISFDSSKISHATELDLLKSNKRGIEDETKAIFYVENDLKTISAYRNGLQEWKINILKVLKTPPVGRPEIRYIKLIRNSILITFGKHSFILVDCDTGKVISIESD